MKPSQFVKKFSAVVYEDSLRRGVLQNLSEDLGNILELTRFHSGLKFFLESRKPSHTDKFSLLDGIPDLHLHEYSRAVLELLMDYGRLRLLKKVTERIRNLREEDRRIAKVRFFHALPLEEAYFMTLKERLHTMLGRELEFEHELRPELLGGMTLKIDNVVIDGSLSRQLEQVRHLLKKKL